MEKLMALEGHALPQLPGADGFARDMGNLPWIGTHTVPPQEARHWDPMPAEPIDNLATDLLASRNLLSALAGPSFVLTVDARHGELPVRMTGEDLTRILVNLVKNAVEAMPAGGRIQLGLRETAEGPGAEPWLTLTIEDNGPGIPRDALEMVFEPGYTTRSKAVTANDNGNWAEAHRGLGLSITRSIVEAAGGHIHAAIRDPAGVCFQIELPVRTR
jgi:signal transduction histidine kinase